MRKARNESKTLIAICDVKKLQELMGYYATRRYIPTGEWIYANQSETIVSMPMVIEPSGVISANRPASTVPTRIT